MAEVQQLADEGCKEITLLGQTVNSYKSRHGDGRTIAAAAICSPAFTTSTGIERIKFVTNFPKDMTDDLLDAVRDLPKVVQVPARAGAIGLQRSAQADEAAVHGRILSRDAGPLPGEDAGRGDHAATSSSAFAARPRNRSRRHATSCRIGISRTASSSSTARGRAPRARDIRRRHARRGQEPRNNDLLAIQNTVSLQDHRRCSADAWKCSSRGRASTVSKQEQRGGPIAAHRAGR